MRFYNRKIRGVSYMKKNEKLKIKLQEINWLLSSTHRCLSNHDLVKRLQSEIDQLKEEIKKEEK
jgi:hypothetical protein